MSSGTSAKREKTFRTCWFSRSLPLSKASDARMTLASTVDVLKLSRSSSRKISDTPAHCSPRPSSQISFPAIDSASGNEPQSRTISAASDGTALPAFIFAAANRIATDSSNVGFRISTACVPQRLLIRVLISTRLSVLGSMKSSMSACSGLHRSSRSKNKKHDSL